MKKIFQEGLIQWQEREVNKLYHYRDMIKKNNLREGEKKIIAMRIKKVEELLGNIEVALDDYEGVNLNE